MAARISPAAILLAGLFLALSGCASEENSPEQGAIPPKPNPEMIKNLPPDVREKIENPGKDPHAEAMAKAAAARKSGQ